MVLLRLLLVVVFLLLVLVRMMRMLLVLRCTVLLRWLVVPRVLALLRELGVLLKRWKTGVHRTVEHRRPTLAPASVLIPLLRRRGELWWPRERPGVVPPPLGSALGAGIPVVCGGRAWPKRGPQRRHCGVRPTTRDPCRMSHSFPRHPHGGRALRERAPAAHGHRASLGALGAGHGLRSAARGAGASPSCPWAPPSPWGCCGAPRIGKEGLGKADGHPLVHLHHAPHPSLAWIWGSPACAELSVLALACLRHFPIE